MKRYLRLWGSSELILGIGLTILWIKNPFIVNGIGAAYVISQAIRKSNRGYFYSGFVTAEFIVTVLLITYNFKLPWYFSVGNYAIYALCRGYTHTIGVKTQMIMR